MKVLLVNGSPHQKGCTYTALSEIAVTLHGRYEAEVKIKYVFDQEAHYGYKNHSIF